MTDIATDRFMSLIETLVDEGIDPDDITTAGRALLGPRLAPGGWDGVEISFGDGCDTDTLGSVLGPFLAKGWTTEFTLKNGEHFTVEPIDFDQENDVTVVRYHPWNDFADEGLGAVDMTVTKSVRFDELVKMEVW